MTKRFRLGLVVGKFAPLHLGHELVIRRAIEECDDVLVISYSKPEHARCGPAARDRWLAARFPQVRRVVLGAETYPSPTYDDIPPNDADALLHRRFVARICLDHRLIPDAVFTSEAYGDGFASEMTHLFAEVGAGPVMHVLVDLERRLHPISGSAIRADVHAHAAWLSPIVYADFVERIAILGGESSGKSSLAAALAARFDTTFIPEYGRTLWEERRGALEYEDLLRIAQTHVRMEDEAALSARRFLFSDTSPLTTRFYSLHLFGRAEPELEALANRSYNQVVLCAPDFPFVQDGTRGDAALRQEQHEWYLRELREREIEHLVVTGSIEERVVRVAEHLKLAVNIPKAVLMKLASRLILLLALLFAGEVAASVRHVPADHSTIQAAVDACAVGDVVLVAPGTYHGVGNRDIDFHGVDLTVISEAGPEQTILDCDHAGRGFLFRNWETPAARVSGFTIQNGVAPDDPLLVGGGIMVLGSSPTIDHCVITDCSAFMGGGAWISVSEGSLTDCTITKNSAYGAGGGGGLYLQFAGLPGIEWVASLATSNRLWV